MMHVCVHEGMFNKYAMHSSQRQAVSAKLTSERM